MDDEGVRADLTASYINLIGELWSEDRETAALKVHDDVIVQVNDMELDVSHLLIFVRVYREWQIS